MSDLEIKVVSYETSWNEIKAIRRAVFQEEQGVDEALEFDGLDAGATQFLAYWQGNAVGTARMRNLDDSTVKIERLAVLKAARGRGIGSQLMRKAIALAKEGGRDRAVVNAQEYVKQLYENLGFEAVGELFEEAGIPHIKMVLKF
ncbi:GNAT family N-acetyltransferase [Oscillatoria sp. FACHB-1406]|uniref:GNAT family N-acetyltransferase n=1 Tax=Oscillatoria sp. FACHB-1406 TaxID=2692846 RepID=UPI00168491D6|nr:GNAT family N-acetyltransferase [Oscillatoria sp. FACHB-1406]MBD2576778.1 GNAT family N-acetyltransferase [Oscillatoria sp. FACHB-1406]